MGIEIGEALNLDQASSHGIAGWLLMMWDSVRVIEPPLEIPHSDVIMVWMTGVDELVVWLLEGDPSIRWRVHRDLLGSPSSTVTAERARVATEGWGAKLISLRDPDGRWDGGDYSPKWTSTTYAPSSGLAWTPATKPAALAGCERLWEWQSRWRGPETCIVSILVRLTAAHGYDAECLDDVVGYLLGQQLDDGGWNCAARGDRGKHSSFHTSILALEALDAYQRAGGGAATEQRRHEGGSFSCGIGSTSPIAPARWQSVAVRASPSCPSGTSTCCAGLSTSPTWAPTRTNGWATLSPSWRARRSDGRWPTYAGYPGRTWFRMEEPGPSRWNTVRVLRVLDWWDEAG